MNRLQLTLVPDAPIVLRDGRDLSLFHYIERAELPYPTTLAGMLRSLTYYHLAYSKDKDEDKIANLLKLAVRGPWLREKRIDTEGVYYFAPPSDAVRIDDIGNHVRLQLRTPGNIDSAVCGFWHRGEALKPDSQSSAAIAPDLAEQLGYYENPHDEKVRQNPDAEGWPLWPLPVLVKWLLQPAPLSLASELKNYTPPAWLIRFESRAHVALNDRTLTAEPGLLFATGGVRFGENACLDFDLLSEQNNSLPPLPRHVALGGESRGGTLEERETPLPTLNSFIRKWDQVKGNETTLASWLGKQRKINKLLGVRLYLCSHAQAYEFDSVDKHAWACPWMYEHEGDECFGSFPNTDIKLTLRGVCLPGGPLTISGWNLVAKGPRAIRRLLPAGTLFDFDFHQQQPGDSDLAKWLESMWMAPIDGGDLKSQLDNHLAAPSSDGLGIVLPGLRWQF